MSAPRASGREWLAAIVVGIVLTTVLTYPTARHPATYGRLDSGDGRYSIWNIGWIDHALLTDPRHLLDANIFYPHTGTLAYSELNLVAGVLGLPVFALTGNAIAAENSAILLALFASFLLMWALVRRLTGSAAAGLVAATCFTFCPYVDVHTPHIQLLMVAAFPLVFLCFDRFRECPGLLRAVWLGVALVIAGLACAYYGIYAGLALGLVALLFAERAPRYWIGLGVAAVTAGVLIAPAMVPYLGARAAVAGRSSVPSDEISGYSASVATYLSSPSVVDEHLPGLRPASESVFPGGVVLALALVGVIAVLRTRHARDRRVVFSYVAVAAVATWASFGPGLGLYTVLARVVPAMGLLRAPVRFGVLVTFALSVVAAFGARALIAGCGWLGPVLVAAAAIELASVPWPLVPVGPEPQAYRLLATLPRGVVVEFPFPYKPTDFHNHTHAMLNSTYHWQPLVNGYSDVTPPDFFLIAAPINAFPDANSFALMKRLDVKYVVWHVDPRSYNADALATLKARFPPYAANLRQLTSDNDTWLYEIVRWPESTQ